MTESSWPFDNNVDTSEQQFSTLLRKISDSGVDDTAAGSLLKPYADSTGMFVKIPAGSAIINGFQYLNDALVTKPIVASESQPRIDTVILRLDPTANTILLDVKKGTASTTPTPPALTQVDNPIGVWEEPLGDVQVPANSSTVTAGQVSDRRRFTSHRWGHWTNGVRPTAPRKGKPGFNESTGQPEWFDGTNWQPFAQTTTDASKLTSGSLSSARLDYGVPAGFRGGYSVDAPVDQYGQINGDWNLALQPNTYRVFQGNNNANMPSGAYPYGTLLVVGAGSSMSSRTQVYFEHGGNGFVYTRTAWNGNDWNGWNRLTRQADIDGLSSALNNGQLDGRYYREDEINGFFSARDTNITNANNNANQRVFNQGNAGRMAAGNALVSNFSSTGYGGTSAYAGYVDVSWPGMSLVSVVATAQSADTGGCTASVSNLSNTGCRITLVRRNNTATGVDWLAVGN